MLKWLSQQANVWCLVGTGACDRLPERGAEVRQAAGQAAGDDRLHTSADGGVHPGD